MATLSFSSGSSQFVGFTGLAGGLVGLTSGAHTLFALSRQTSTGAWRQCLTVANNARTTAHATLGFNSGNSMVYDSSRSSVDDATAWTNTTDWIAMAVTINTADTPDAIFHRRNHTTDAAWTHINGNGSPGYEAAGIPASNGFMQIGRWLTSDYWNGQIAVIAAWNRKLSNSDLDEIVANDATNDIYALSSGAPDFLVELNVVHADLVDVMDNSTLDTPVNSPTLTGGDPDRWTFGLGPILVDSLTHDWSRFPKYKLRR